ncbi:MAG: carboxypeptidase-like regulatory domain-containing protein, partial [Bacteroidota bacterium]
MHRILLPTLVLLATGVLSNGASGQPAVVIGSVVDAEGAPLPGANVYLSSTTRGDASGRDGRFEIAGIAPGAYRLVGSMLGYETTHEDLRLTPGDTATVDLVLAAAPVALGSVEVEAERDGRWQRRFAWFRRALVGESSRADSIVLLNPEVLSFRLRWGTLRAEAAAPLVFENRALGYRLTYDLSAFSASATRIQYDGDERFEELPPADSAEALRWRSVRESAYRGSLQHLLRSLLHGTSDADGFAFELIWEDPWGARPAFRATTRGLMRVDDDGWGTLRIRDR